MEARPCGAHASEVALFTKNCAIATGTNPLLLIVFPLFFSPLMRARARTVSGSGVGGVGGGVGGLGHDYLLKGGLMRARG